ncbi:MAG: hypothetical protein Q7T99_15450 [Pseudomonas sp.]|nr:hypothetical protein [Pseudomonas sp.]
MKERPILFKGPLVRAILAGQKTVTRRLLKMPHGFWEASATGELVPIPANCPYGKPGDRLWVRETWARVGNCDPGYLTFAATYPDCLPPELENIPAASEIRWKPSIHMFRRDSRILLEITDVRVERLQDITWEQALDEGIGDHRFECDRPVEPDGYPACSCGSVGYVDAFAALWNSTGGDWDANPWVWVVEFKRVTPP